MRAYQTSMRSETTVARQFALVRRRTRRLVENLPRWVDFLANGVGLFVGFVLFPLFLVLAIARKLSS